MNSYQKRPKTLHVFRQAILVEYFFCLVRDLQVTGETERFQTGKVGQCDASDEVEDYLTRMVLASRGQTSARERDGPYLSIVR